MKKLFLLSFMLPCAVYAQTSKPTSIDTGLGSPARPQVFTYVQQMPRLTVDLDEYLQKNIQYPTDARDNGIQGRVVVKFIVNDKGETENATVVRSVYPSLDAEALRVVKNMPPWKPATQDGKAVSVYFTIPVTFSLSK